MNKSAQNKQLERVPATHALLEVLEDVQNQKNATNSMPRSSPENSVTENFYTTELCSHMQNTTGLTAEDIPIIHQRSLFDELLENSSLICLPANWYIAISLTKKCIAVYELEWKSEEEVFAKHIRARPLLQRHGFLLLDEISLRESISVKSSDLTYTGLVNFGEDGKRAENIGETAKYALVLMFQPLADKYTQPIAVFASRGPVKGVELAKLVAKALVLLENTGTLVHGIVSDGVETNRKM